MFYFYTPWERQKTLGFLTFSGGIEMEHSLKWVNHYKWVDLFPMFMIVEDCVTRSCNINSNLIVT